MNLSSANLDDIWRGITILAGGGGGDPDMAQANIASAVTLPVPVTTLADLPNDATVVTVFGVGSVGNTEAAREAAVQRGLETFTGTVGIDPDAVMPVEAGAGTIAEACLAVKNMDIPLVNADHVGMRCAPDIRLETITLAGLDRAPLVAATADDTAIIRSAASVAEIEDRLRDLASDRTWYVTGYPLTVEQLQGTVTTGWTERACRIGQAIEQEVIGQVPGISVIAEGRIGDVDLRDVDGFTIGRITVDADSRYEVYVKNENIMVERDGTCIAAAPDNIVLFDVEEACGVYNGNVPSPGTRVQLLAIEASPLWDSRAGRALFRPDRVGFRVDADAVQYKDITRWER